MGFFKKEDTVDFSRTIVNDGHGCSASGYASEDDSADDNDCDFEIVFFKELSTGALVFNIIDDDGEHAGHVVVSSLGNATVLENTILYDMDNDERQYIKDQAEKFYQSTR